MTSSNVVCKPRCAVTGIRERNQFATLARGEANEERSNVQIAHLFRARPETTDGRCTPKSLHRLIRPLVAAGRAVVRHRWKVSQDFLRAVSYSVSRGNFTIIQLSFVVEGGVVRDSGGESSTVKPLSISPAHSVLPQAIQSLDHEVPSHSALPRSLGSNGTAPTCTCHACRTFCRRAFVRRCLTPAPPCGGVEHPSAKTRHNPGDSVLQPGAAWPAFANRQVRDLHPSS